MERNARQTTTLGVGEMLQDAVNRGAQHIVLAIGGSATNDAGLGMATALGYQFFDKNGRKLKPIGENLSKVVNIEPPEKLLDLPTVDVICDVKNPLFGETGAAYVYARQKGATNDDIAYLDEGLRHFASVASSFRPEVSPFREGMGAAGGMGFGAALFLKAYLKNGIDLVLDLIDFDSKLKNVDWVITGEGSLDSQTAHGKLIEGVCRRAAKQNIPVIALCGKVDVPPQLISDLGLRAAFSINSKLTSLPEALAATAENLEKTAYNVGRLFIK
jgi:glycerate kinase